MCRLLVAMNNTHNTNNNNNNNNNNNDYDDSSSVVVTSHSLKFSKFRALTFRVCQEATKWRKKRMKQKWKQLKLSARSIASSVSRLAGWLNEHFSTKSNRNSLLSVSLPDAF